MQQRGSQRDLKHQRDSSIVAGRVPPGIHKKQCGQPLAAKTLLTVSKKIETSVPHHMELNSAISETN